MTKKRTKITDPDDDRPSWDDTWLAVAEIVSKRSRCSRAQMGAAIVSKDNRVAATGYNGPAATWGFELGKCIEWCERAKGNAPLDNLYDACPSIHAEANALLYVDRSSVEGGTIYITNAPCMQCAKLISNSGISRVVCRLRASDRHREPHKVVGYLRFCGIEVDYIKDSDYGDEQDGD
jgi:dCMP deaminase